MFSILIRCFLMAAPLFFASLARADESECRNITSEGARIVGGIPGNEQDWPGFVRLEYDGWPFCAATVIDEFWALTAAHCVDVGDISSQSLRVGQGAKSIFEASPISLQVEAAYIHPLYQPEAWRFDYPGLNDGHDIALLKLASPADIDFATLYGPDDYEYISTGTCLDVVGWGNTEGVGPDFEEDRAAIDIRLIDELVARGIMSERVAARLQNQNTRERLMGLVLTLIKPPKTSNAEKPRPVPSSVDELLEAAERQKGFNVAKLPKRDEAECGPDGTGHRGDLSKVLCAGFKEGGIDTCQGDSGGPVYYQTNRNIYQVGIVSWGIGCANANLPGIYVNTSAYLDWIDTLIDYGETNQIPADTLAMLSIAHAHFWGMGVEEDELKALELLQPGLNDRDPQVLSEFAEMCLSAVTPQFIEECTRVNTELIQAGNLEPILVQSYAYFWGHGTEMDEARALEFLQQGISAGAPEAVVAFEDMCENAYEDAFVQACKVN